MPNPDITSGEPPSLYNTNRSRPLVGTALRAVRRTQHSRPRRTRQPVLGLTVLGLDAEFPSLSWLASAPETALRGVRSLVADVINDMKKQKEPVPALLASRRFSGKFMVRVPPNIRRELAVEAAEAGVRLNRLASAKLAH